MDTTFLAIESSCDETAVAFAGPEGFQEPWLMSQTELQARYGGVVPELASREHAQRFRDLTPALLSHPRLPHVTQIAVTLGPGLPPCLAMGIVFAHTLGCVLGVPVCGVNHLRGHAYSPFMGAGGRGLETLQDACPHLGLLVSGGNTLLFEMLTPGHIRVLGRTRDDAAGEAIDKGARLLGLPYPGGPPMQAHAQGGDAQRYAFPRGLCKDPGFDFSFSGLKTALRYTLDKMDLAQRQQALADLCASYQQAVVDALVHKVAQALGQGSYRSLGLSGGVAQNRLLRQALGQLAQREGLAFWPAEPAHCGDNATMIAFAAYVDPGHTVPALGSRLPVASSWTLDAAAPFLQGMSATQS